MRQWPEKKWWSGRVDDLTNPSTYRWHQRVMLAEPGDTQGISQTISGIHLVGYACDLGTRLNKGRPGSATGPLTIRKELARLAWHGRYPVVDQGDILEDGKSVLAIQEELAVLIFSIVKTGNFPIVLGGSHDLTYGHFKGIYEHLLSVKDQVRLGVINFDAHLDLRPYSEGPHSGSSFLQIADLMQTKPENFKYFCLGVEKLANTQSLFEKAKETGTQMVEGMHCQYHFLSFILSKLQEFLSTVDYVVISIDMDGFKACHAPGVSAPAHLGYDPEFVQAVLPHLFASRKIIGFDIAETNPHFDQDGRTSRLAASIIHRVAAYVDTHGLTYV